MSFNVKLVFTFVLAFLISCTETKTKETDSDLIEIHGEAQGTTYTVKLVGKGKKVTKSEIDQLLNAFDDYLSTYKANSKITLFNANSDNFEFTDEFSFFTRCLNESQVIFENTDGAFDPTVFPLIEAWGFFKDEKHPLTKAGADSILPYIGFQKDKLLSYRVATYDADGKKLTLTKIDNRVKLDFNAIAQGLSVDIVYEFLKEKGFKNIFVEIGGEIRVAGKNQEGNEWRIGIDKPVDEQERELQAVVSLTNRSLATSGNYRKYYEIDGKRYAHTINPKTGLQVEHNLLSATVLAPNCAQADGYATAFMVMGKDKTLEFVKTHPELKLDVFLITFEKGKFKTYSTKGVEISE